MGAGLVIESVRICYGEAVMLSSAVRAEEADLISEPGELGQFLPLIDRAVVERTGQIAHECV